MSAPEWIKEILLAVLGSASVAAGVRWFFKSRREDRKEELARWEAEREAYKVKIDNLQSKVEALLMDAIAREKENNIQMKDRLEMDRKMNEVIFSATTALKESAVVLSRYQDVGR